MLLEGVGLTDERPTSNRLNIELLKDEHRTSNVQHRILNEKKGDRRINVEFRYYLIQEAAFLSISSGLIFHPINAS